MGMKIVTDSKTDDGWTISATAADRTIDIDLERLTPRTTRMRVVANNGIIFKDRATEAAIIDEAADALDRHTVAKN
jgi:ABC-type antimicrobial peptide transport system ATPase subunit